MCYHGKFHPLTDIKGEYIPAAMYRYLENIILQDSQKNSHQENEVPATQKLTNFEITNDKMCCKYCTKSLFLYIQS